MAIETAPNRIEHGLGQLERRIMRRAMSAARRAEREGIPHFACATLDITVDVAWLAHLTLADAQSGPVWYWKDRRSNGAVMVGYGVSGQMDTHDGHRFARMRDQWHHDRSRIVAAKSDVVRFFFGFSFSQKPLRYPWTHWPNGLLTLPKFLFAAHPNGQSSVTVIVQVSHSGEVQALTQKAIRELDFILTRHATEWNENRVSRGAPRKDALHGGDFVTSTNEAEFRRMVTLTAADIRADKYEKAVMARQEVHKNIDLSSVPEALEWLRCSYPDNTTFAVRYGDECFLGASPERLAVTQSGTVIVDCLAGTTGRGSSLDEDAALGRALSDSEKNVKEHKVVVHAITRMLDSCATDVRLDVDRQLLRLPNVQHLYSRVTGSLNDGTTLFDLADLLHPTPAIAGQPTVVATRTILEREPFERGWYAGGIGVMDADGNGEIAVTLRSALATDGGTVLFAGCGIMGDSNPDAEWIETELKLRPMRAALSSRNDRSERK